MVAFVQAISKVSVHHENYYDELTMVTKTIFDFADQSSDDIRE